MSLGLDYCCQDPGFRSVPWSGRLGREQRLAGPSGLGIVYAVLVTWPAPDRSVTLQRLQKWESGLHPRPEEAGRAWASLLTLGVSKGSGQAASGPEETAPLPMGWGGRSHCAQGPGPWGSPAQQASGCPAQERFPRPTLRRPSRGDFSPIFKRQLRIFISYQPQAMACSFSFL